jgi:tetratricopeptide (TPR) repeat protein
VFDNLLRVEPRKNIYLLLSVCFKKIENYEETERILDECLKKYPKYYEAYIYRGKLYLKVRKYEKALNDF